MSNQTLNSLMVEAAYRNKEANIQKDENGEFEWIDWESFDGKTKRIKKYKDPRNI